MVEIVDVFLESQEHRISFFVGGDHYSDVGDDVEYLFLEQSLVSSQPGVNQKVCEEVSLDVDAEIFVAHKLIRVVNVAMFEILVQREHSLKEDGLGKGHIFLFIEQLRVAEPPEGRGVSVRWYHHQLLLQPRPLRHAHI